MERLSRIILVGATVATVTASAVAQRLMYDGREFSVRPNPTTVGREVLVPARPVADRIGATIRHDGRFATIRWQNNTAEFRSGDRSYTMNGRRRSFSTDPLQRGDILYIPATFFEELTNNRFRVADDRWGDKGRPGDYGYGSRIYWNGRELRFNRDEEPFNYGRTMMVPFRALGDQIGARTERTEDGKRVILRYGRNEVVYDTGRTWYRINRQRRELPTSSQDRRGVYFVPIELFEAVTDGRLSTRR